MEFIKDQRVSLQNNISQKGRIDFIHKPQGGYQYYDVMLDDGSLQTLSEFDLLSEIIVNTPWDLLSNNILKDYQDFSIATTLHKVRNTSANTISSLKASRTIFYPYQFKPLVKFLKSDTKRILIADEVGLGKTIEAGHIMLELAARGNLKNALVICSKSLCDKWKFELQDKFNFSFKVYDSTKSLIFDIKDDLNGSKKSIFGIINYERCRNLELQKLISDNNYQFDILICDEAHRIRNSETAQHKGVAKIVDFSEAVIFMTATPIMTSLENLHSLIRLLDKEAYDTYSVFNNAVSQNRPFIRALSSLNAGASFKTVSDELSKSIVRQELLIDSISVSHVDKQIDDIFENDPLYQRVINRMNSENNSFQNRILIQNDLIELNSINYLYTRTRKKDVREGQDYIVRQPHTLTVSLTQHERDIYDSVMLQYSAPENLGIITKKRQMASSIVASQIARESLIQGIYDSSIPDSKFMHLKDIVNKIVKQEGKKLIVFAYFKNTLLYLNIKLKELGIQCAIIHGDVDSRTDVINNFQQNENIKILLSSEVGSEGIDLQFCDALVNYDLPWNPMVVEQRIGRIDRVGQKSNIITIFNLIIIDTIEERIYTKLYDRIKLFQESIGDLEEILGEQESLGEQISQGIERLYATALTIQQQEEILDTLSLAIIGNREILKNIQHNLSEAFANDLHFQNEIKYITENNRYLTKTEIVKYIESIIRNLLSTLHIKHINKDESHIDIPANSLDVLFKFIEEHKDPIHINPEMENMYRKFKRFIGRRSIALTFDQKYAYEHKDVEYISAFHPLVNATTNYFERHGFNQNQAHRVSIKQDILSPELGILAGYYILAIYSISVKKDFGNGKPRQLDYLRSVLCDINGDSAIMKSSEMADHLYGKIQIDGEQMFSTITLDPQIVEEIRSPILMKMIEEEAKTKIDEEIRFISSINRRAEQEINYLDNRIERIQQQIRDGNGIEAILKKNLEDVTNRKGKLIENQENSNITVTHKLISVNLVEVL